MFTKDQRDASFSLVMESQDSNLNKRFHAGYSKNKAGKTVYSVTGMPVFRSGTFRNSYGEQQTWTDFHVQQMVSNFTFLRDSQTFTHVPVRVSHPDTWFRNAMEEVIGYVTNISAEKLEHPGTGEQFTYLLADYEILDKTAAEKIDSGLFRNRSAEIGMYVDNNESEFYPVLTGFAYVDIPAVEGLNFGKRVANVRNFAVEKEDGGMAKEVETEEVVEEPEVVETEEVVEEPEVVETEEVVEEPEVVETEEVVEEPEVVDDEPVILATHETNLGDPKSDSFASGGFSVNFNGQTITDPSVIQGLLNSLGEQVIEDRAAYVNRMFSEAKITSSQKEALSEFTAGLTIEQWGQFRSIYDDSPANPTITFQSGAIEIDAETPERDVQEKIEAHLRMALGKERFARWQEAQANKNKGVS